MTYREAAKLKAGDVVLLKETYEEVLVHRVDDQPQTRNVTIHCSAGILPHKAVMKYMTPDEIAQELLKRKGLKVRINHNWDTGEELYSVEVLGTDAFWLASFDTQVEAEKYIEDHQLVLVVEKPVA